MWLDALALDARGPGPARPGLPRVPAYAAEDFDAGLAANRSLETGLPVRTRDLLPPD
ncbi:hypothetical protein GCM10011428_48790 [Streptomyces violaceus]